MSPIFSPLLETPTHKHPRPPPELISDTRETVASMNTETAIALVFTGIMAAASMGKFMEAPEKRKVVQSRQLPGASQSAPSATLTPEECEVGSDTFRRDIFVVFGVLGEKLLNLGVVNEPWLPIAREEVIKCLGIKGPAFYTIFSEDMEDAMQYAVAAAMFLCAGCWPLPIYPGFGACVLNDWLWAYPGQGRVNEPETRQFDDCIALLKTASQGHDLLKAYPKGLNQMSPSYDKLESQDIVWYIDDKNSQCKKRGRPRLFDGSVITDIIWPCSTYNSQFALQNQHTYDYSGLSQVLRWQQDAGRMIYGFLVGGFLDLQYGQMMEPMSEIATSILWWLYGLNGMTFKLIYQGQLDISHWKLKKKYQQRWLLEAQQAIYALRDESRVQLRDATRLAMASVLPTSLPPPPAYSLRNVEAQFDFSSRGTGELSFQKGDVLEILRDSNGDGWLIARGKDGVEGKIPEAYVRTL
ncbi:hypothetical protein QBC46DRAFT_316570 [Diplogelasinospora grovesii]|uniref:SH3 domain-containing protein n=1 Tax=Diplogelasinospora grovesii TaxID=303347 RepID=A0AAN6N4F3_9PEZI|nr:hypothetical protein QBC46DRAFT_316570 [Diplogelasinospora grovesii]